MTTEIILTKKGQSDISTGLVRATDTFEASSGFSYFSGARQFGDLKIVEDVAVGTGVSYLNSVKVYDKNHTVIIDKRMHKGCFYEREVARRIVRDELLNMLENASKANGDKFDRMKAVSVIDKHLANAYYEKSRNAILEWYDDLLNL